MRQIRCLLSLALLGACATSAPHSDRPISNVLYSAAGHDSRWMLLVSNHDLAFREAGEVWRLTRRPREQVMNGVRIWESVEPWAGIVVERRSGPCVNPQGQSFDDHVRVLLTGDVFDSRDGSVSQYREELSGCGGPGPGREEVRQ